MSPFGALSRNRGSRKPVAYNSILNPGGTLGCAPAGLFMTCARLIVRAFDLGGGNSCTLILRVTLGASLVQPPIAALPVRTAPFSAVVPIRVAVTKKVAQQTVRKILSLDRWAFILLESLGRQTSRGFEASGRESICHNGATA